MIEFFAGSCLSGLGIVVKKPSSIRGLDGCIVLNRLPLSKDKTGFFIMSPYPRVLSEKIQSYLRRAFAKSFIRLTASGIFDWRDHAV